MLKKKSAENFISERFSGDVGVFNWTGIPRQWNPGDTPDFLLPFSFACRPNGPSSRTASHQTKHSPPRPLLFLKREQCLSVEEWVNSPISSEENRGAIKGLKRGENKQSEASPRFLQTFCINREGESEEGGGRKKKIEPRKKRRRSQSLGYRRKEEFLECPIACNLIFEVPTQYFVSLIRDSIHLLCAPLILETSAF
ncbi:hypothetical protein SLEP1_g58847 [Rubroshorea leprosula]|uniref:Uncharacterized protein n=1 Tax=Rubroshorea leprosula TaxID=152421 RepID=A0AAV5MT36_9ROSI|nr:hypothetical protein SLEP1_g58847 [Rubroshorea leprosula]